MPPAEEIAMASNATESDAKRVKLTTEGSSSDNDKSNPESSGYWRNNVEGLRKINGYALKNKILTDVTFKVGLEGKEIHAHRLILALASPVFEAMFYGGLAEKENVVAIPDVTPEGFRCLLTYLYTESCAFESANEAFESCLAADKYCLPHLKRECEQYICMCHLSPENVWSFLDNSLLLNLKTVTKACVDFLRDHTRSCLETRPFLEAGKEAILQVLALDTMDVDEISLLQSIVYWSEAQAENESLIEGILNPLIRHIRFGSFKPNEFCAFLEENGKYLNDSDALAILKHLIKPTSYALPEWCCSKTWRVIRGANNPEYPDEENGKSGSRGRNTSKSRNSSRSRARNRSKGRRSYNLNELRNRSRSPRSLSGVRICKVLTINNGTSSESESSSGSSIASTDPSTDSSD